MRWVLAVLLLAAIAVGVWYVGQPAPSSEPSQVPAGAAEVVVEYVHDGDTLFLADGRTVRLLGVDTPEIGDHAECYGQEATALLRELLPEGSTAWAVADVQELDQYGRSLLFLYLPDGTLVNLALIEQGAAEAVVLPPNLLLADELEAAEDRAQAAALGRWAACG
jgi:micrococcal nuclease